MSRKTIGEAMISIALWLWKTDITFWQYPYGPPDRGIRGRLAWWAYHRGLELSE